MRRLADLKSLQIRITARFCTFSPYEKCILLNKGCGLCLMCRSEKTIRTKNTYRYASPHFWRNLSSGGAALLVPEMDCSKPLNAPPIKPKYFSVILPKKAIITQCVWFLKVLQTFRTPHFGSRTRIKSYSNCKSSANLASKSMQNPEQHMTSSTVELAEAGVVVGLEVEDDL